MPAIHNRKLQNFPEKYQLLLLCSRLAPRDAKSGAKSIPQMPQSRYPTYKTIRVTKGSNPSCRPTSRGSNTVRDKNVAA